MPSFIQIPSYIENKYDKNNSSFLNKISLLIQGKFLVVLINKFNDELFCKLINLFYFKNKKILYENQKFVYLDKRYKIYYPNKRVLRAGFDINNLLDKLVDDYCLDQFTLNNNDLVIDCGANVGEFYFALCNLQENFNYIGIEPDPKNFECLETNLKNYQDIKLLNIALGSSNEKLTFFLSDDGADSSLINPGFSKTIEINTRTLDSLGLNKVKLLKVEAEGYEPEILLNSRNLLTTTEYVSVDAGPERGQSSKNTFAEVTKILFDSNFELIKFNEKRCVGLFKNKNF